jgi:hypothetical protein
MSIQKNASIWGKTHRTGKARRTLPAAFALMLCVAAAGVRAQAPVTWMKLFDGKDLSGSGWKYVPEFWSVDGGILKGQGKATFNTFCHTDRKYSDFVLSVKARLWQTQAGYTNSGLQYRSDFIDSASHRMKGYQVDIGDDLDGAMYPEANYPADAKMVFNEPCKKFIKSNDWNHYLVTANGGKVRHELNGNFCAEYTASLLDGYIGLQMHATSLVMKVDFKDLYIRPLNNSFVVPEALATTLDEAYAATSIAPRAAAADARIGVDGNNLYIPAAFLAGRSGPIDISLKDFRGRTVYSRPAQSVGGAALSIVLPALAAGGHVLSITGAGTAYAGVLR